MEHNTSEDLVDTIAISIYVATIYWEKQILKIKVYKVDFVNTLDSKQCSIVDADSMTLVPEIN